MCAVCTFIESALSLVCARPSSPLQVADSFNKLITLMSSISNFDDQFRKLEITANGTRYDLDALAERYKGPMPPACLHFCPPPGLISGKPFPLNCLARRSRA